jgi:hypothetical protein
MGKKTGLPANGWYRFSVGLEKRHDGALVPFRAYTSKDPQDHKNKCVAIKARWVDLKAQGQTHWTIADIAKLEDDGLIRPRYAVDQRHAMALVKDVYTEPLTRAEIEPFIDENGKIKPDAAPAAADYMGRKIFTRVDVRSVLYNVLLIEALRDPIGTFERCNRLFGWNGQAAREMIAKENNVDINVYLNDDNDPSKVDASKIIDVTPAPATTDKPQTSTEIQNGPTEVIANS